MTNGDVIRQMDDKELFDNFIFKMDCDCCQFRNECTWEDADECEKFWMSWLKQESEEKPREHIGILPVPCTKVEEETVKEWFQKINEELDELKEAVLVRFKTCDDADAWAKYSRQAETNIGNIALEATDTITSITSMLEAMGINEEARQAAQKQVNRKNEERGRL